MASTCSSQRLYELNELTIGDSNQLLQKLYDRTFEEYGMVSAELMDKLLDCALEDSKVDEERRASAIQSDVSSNLTPFQAVLAHADKLVAMFKLGAPSPAKIQTHVNALGALSKRFKAPFEAVDMHVDTLRALVQQHVRSFKHVEWVFARIQPILFDLVRIAEPIKHPTKYWQSYLAENMSIFGIYEHQDAHIDRVRDPYQTDFTPDQTANIDSRLFSKKHRCIPIRRIDNYVYAIGCNGYTKEELYKLDHRTAFFSVLLLDENEPLPRLPAGSPLTVIYTRGYRYRKYTVADLRERRMLQGHDMLNAIRGEITGSGCQTLDRMLNDYDYIPRDHERQWRDRNVNLTGGGFEDPNESTHLPTAGNKQDYQVDASMRDATNMRDSRRPTNMVDSRRPTNMIDSRRPSPRREDNGVSLRSSTDDRVAKRRRLDEGSAFDMLNGLEDGGGYRRYSPPSGRR